MVRRKELPAIFMPWSVAQIHSVLADSDYLAKFHKESHGSSSVKVEPWDPQGSGSGFVWKRRCLFTAPLQGPPWFKTMLGGPQLVDMMDTQEMMYDPESGCMMVQVESYMLLDGGATTMRMRHMQWLYRPVKAEDLTGCEVKATLTTCGASFRNAQLQDLPQQVEDALVTIATEEATEFNNFALCYIGALQEAGQLPTPEQALSKLMDTRNGRPLFSGPKTPGKLADMPFNLVSGVLVYKDKNAPQYMDLPAGRHGANTISPTENSDNSTPVDMQGAADLQQRDLGSAPPVTGERLSMTDSVLEGIPAGGKEVDNLLGTKLNSLDLATAGRSLRIRTWRSRAHDSGMSMRPAYDQRGSDDSQRTQSTAPKHASSDSQPRGPDKSSITAEERALLERLTHEHNGKEGGPQLNPKERRMVDEILVASMEADQLAAGMEPEAGRDMHLNSSYRKDHQHDGAETTPAPGPEPARGEWADLREYDRALSGSLVDSLRSSSEYSVSTIGTVSTCAALSPSAIRVWLTPRGGRSLEILQPPEAEHGSVLRGTTARSQGSILGTGSHTGRAPHADWHKQGVSGAISGMDDQAVVPIHWTALTSALEDGAVQPQRGEAFSPKSNFSWQPLSDVGRNDEDDLFPENLMLTEQSDLGLLRNRLAQVLPKENLTRQQNSRQIPEQRSRDEEVEAVRGMPGQQTSLQPHRSAGVPNAMEQAPGAADDQDLELMDTSISERSFKPQNKTHQNGAIHTATTTIVETMFWDAEEDFNDDGTTLNAKLLKALDDAEKHDMHTPEAGVLHTSGSFHIPPTDASDTAVAMANVMSVAIETVNAVAETAVNTVNRITRVSLEHLQSVGHTSSLASHRSIPVPYNGVYQGPWEDKMPLSRQHSLATSADARSFRAPTANQVAPFQQRPAGPQPWPLLQQDPSPAQRGIPEDTAVLPLTEAQRRNFSIEGELQNFRQAGIGRRGAGSAPIFHRGGNGPPRGPLSFQADIAHPKAAGDTRQRSLASSARREEARFEPAGLGDAHKSAPPFAGRKRVKVPPLWTGSSPFEGRLSDTMDSEALSEAQEGMQWVNGKGWVEAERTFLQSFNSAPPLLRRNDSRPSTVPDMAPASRRPSPVPEHRVVFTAQSVEAAPIPSGQDTNAVVQRATREHLMAERRRRAAKLATRGVPPGATDSLPPPRDLPDRRLPTSATKADAAARRRSKGGLCGKLSKMCAAMYACRKSKGARTISYTEPSRAQVSDQAS